jgi:hypothetical protein
VQNQVRNLPDKPTSPSTNGTLPLSRLKLFSPIMHALEDIGIDMNEILEPRGFSVETVDNPSIFVHPVVMYGLVEDAGAAAGIRGFCTAVAENLDLPSWFSGTDYVSEAVTIGDLMTRFTNACSQETTSTAHRLLIDGNRAHFSQQRSAEPNFTPGETDAFNVGIWVSLLHRALGDGWIASEVVVSVCDPDALPEYFHGVKAIKGDRHGFKMCFPTSWLSTQFDRELFNRRLASADEPLPVSPDLVTAVRQALMPYLSQHDLRRMDSAPICLDLLIGCAAPHPYNYRPSQDGVGQIADACEGHGTICRYFFSFDDLAAHHTSARDCAAPMTGIYQASYFFIVPRLRAEHRIDFVEKDRRAAIRVRDLAKEIGGRDVHRLDRAWHQQLGHFQRPRLS